MKTIAGLALCAAAAFAVSRFDPETFKTICAVVGAFTCAYWLTRFVRWLDGEVA